MNNTVIYVVAGIVAVAVAMLVGGVIGVQIAAPGTVPALISSTALQNVFKAYREDAAKVYIVARQVQTAPALLQKSFPGKFLVVTKRILYRGHYLVLREYYNVTSVKSYPDMVFFDVNGDGIFSISEGYILQGDPVNTTPIRASVFVKGATNNVSASHK